MCIVIDSCCLAMVFDGDNVNHASFAPVLEWITGKGCLIYGGTKYRNELKETPKYLALIAELKRAHHAIAIHDANVDAIATMLKVRFPEASFNDEHIVALVIASKCAVVCTVDKIATSYLKRSDLFRAYQVARPSIFTGHKTHKSLCCDKKIVGVCPRA